MGFFVSFFSPAKLASLCDVCRSTILLIVNDDDDCEHSEVDCPDFHLLKGSSTQPSSALEGNTCTGSYEVPFCPFQDVSLTGTSISFSEACSACLAFPSIGMKPSEIFASTPPNNLAGRKVTGTIFLLNHPGQVAT